MFLIKSASHLGRLAQTTPDGVPARTSLASRLCPNHTVFPLDLVPAILAVPSLIRGPSVPTIHFEQTNTTHRTIHNEMVSSGDNFTAFSLVCSLTTRMSSATTWAAWSATPLEWVSPRAETSGTIATHDSEPQHHEVLSESPSAFMIIVLPLHPWSPTRAQGNVSDGTVLVHVLSRVFACNIASTF